MRLKDLVAACDFVTDVQAPGDGTVQCSLAFLEGAQGWFVGTRRDEGYDKLELSAKVTTASPELELSPEKGVKGVVSAVGEAELDDKQVDDAWVIRGDPGLLVAMREELRALSKLAPAITLKEGALTVSFAKLSAADVKPAVSGALALWHRIAFHGM